MSASSRRPLLLAGVCWLVFACVLVAAYWIPLVGWADGWAVQGFLNLHRPWVTNLAVHVAHLANPAPFAIWTVLLASIALRRRRPRHALAVIVLLVGASVVAQVLKEVLAHDRYHDFLGKAQLGSTAFPSGHATASMSLALAAVLVASSRWRPLVAVGGALFTLGVSESVMFLGWHYPSDVLGGFLVATACALTTVAALRAADRRWPGRSGREAARRALTRIDVRRGGAIAGAFVLMVIAVGTAVAGRDTLAFVDRHTTAAFAAVFVAAVAALVPPAVAALGSQRA